MFDQCRRRSAGRTTENLPHCHKTNVFGSYIVTDSHENHKLGASVAREYVHAARGRGCQFISVVLTCSLEENEKRMVSEERLKLVEDGMGLLLDTDTLKETRS